jgi:hypothetical protein
MNIFNLLGQQVYARQIYTTNDGINEDISLGVNLPKGIYFLKVYSDLDSKTVRIFVD